MSHPFQPSWAGLNQRVPGAGEALLRTVLDSAGEAIMITDERGACVFSNQAAARLLGVRPCATPAAEWPRVYGFLLPDRQTVCPDADFPLSRALRGETVAAADLFVCGESHREGAWLSVSAQPLCGGDGVLKGAVLSAREVSDLKAWEEALRRERQRGSALIQTVASLVVVLDRCGRIVSFNRACEHATGYTFEEVKDRNFWDVLLRPEEAEPVKAIFRELCAGRFPNRYENHWVAKDGSLRLISWSNTALPGEGGEVEFVIGTGIDVTVQRRAEAELREANQMLSAVIQTSPLAIVRMDLAGRVQSWNAAAERIFGWKEEEVVGKLFPIVPDDDLPFFWGNLERARRGETLAGVQRQRRRKDGTLIDVALWNAVQRDPSGEITAVISVIADMTERTRLEEQFRQSQKMEAVGRLAGGVAHDFNNLLTVITGYSQMVLDGLAPGNPLRDSIHEILRAAESAAALTNQLLAFSRRQIVQPQVLDLNALVVSMDKMLHRLIGEDIELVTILSPRLAKIKVDPGQFQQVLLNLAVNARDAMPQGGRLTLETAVECLDPEYVPSVPDLPPGAYVVLSVSDTGKGMEEATKRRLFEPFFTTKGKGKGTGLGLSTVYGIVKQSGGDIAVWSEPGRGATFKIYLPALKDAVAASVEGGAAAERRRGTETVLVAEDEAGLRKLIREVLELHGYTVLQASDCREAIRLCEHHLGPIHLVLTDLVMPYMSGRELARNLAALRPRLKALYMSGYTDHVMLDERAEDAELDFLQKPFTPEMLLAKVREVLDRPV